MTLFFICIFGAVAAILIYALTGKPKKKGLSGEEMFTKIQEMQKVADETGKTQRILWPDGSVRVVEPRIKTSEQACIDNLQRVANETGKPTNYQTMDGRYHWIHPEKSDDIYKDSAERYRRKYPECEEVGQPVETILLKRTENKERKENTLEHLPFPPTIQSDTYRRSDNDASDALGYMAAAGLFDSSSNDSTPSSSSNDDFGGFGGGDFGGGGAEGSWSDD